MRQIKSENGRLLPICTGKDEMMIIHLITIMVKLKVRIYACFLRLTFKTLITRTMATMEMSMDPMNTDRMNMVPIMDPMNMETTRQIKP